MGIRDAFKLTWEEAVLRTAMLEGVEIFPDSRSIIRTFQVGEYPVAQFCLAFGDSETPEAITSRFTPDILLLPAYLHILEQRNRLRKAGIVSHLALERGLIQCIYLKEDLAAALMS